MTTRVSKFDSCQFATRKRIERNVSVKVCVCQGVFAFRGVLFQKVVNPKVPKFVNRYTTWDDWTKIEGKRVCLCLSISCINKEET